MRSAVTRCAVWLVLVLVVGPGTGVAFGQTDPLPSWNDGPAKKAILDFVRVTTDRASPGYVAPEARVAAFDQDGTLWVSHPMYAQVVGTMGGTKFGYARDGRPILTKDPRLLLNDDSAGKPEGIHLMIGRRPLAAFGNSDGDRQMLEYTEAGGGARLMMLVLHDDAQREYACGPARGLPDTKVGAFTRRLYEEATRRGRHVISMKDDWKRIFAFDP